MVRKNCEKCNEPFLQSGIHKVEDADKFCSDCEEIENFNNGKKLTRSLSDEPAQKEEVEQGQMELGV